MLEAWNRKDVVEFGGAVERALHHDDSQHDNENGNGNDKSGGTYEDMPKDKKWIWWSTERKYWREVGFLAAFAQFCAATIFWISG